MKSHSYKDASPLWGCWKFKWSLAYRGPVATEKVVVDEKSSTYPRCDQNHWVFSMNTPSSVERPVLLREDASSSQSNVSNPHFPHFTHPSPPTNKSRFLPALLTVINLSKPLRDKMVPRLYLEVPDAPLIEASEAPFLLEKRSKTPPRKGLFSHRNLIIWWWRNRCQLLPTCRTSAKRSNDNSPPSSLDNVG